MPFSGCEDLVRSDRGHVGIFDERAGAGAVLLGGLDQQETRPRAGRRPRDVLAAAVRERLTSRQSHGDGSNTSSVPTSIRVCSPAFGGEQVILVSEQSLNLIPPTILFLEQLIILGPNFVALHQ